MLTILADVDNDLALQMFIFAGAKIVINSSKPAESCDEKQKEGNNFSRPLVAAVHNTGFVGGTS